MLIIIIQTFTTALAVEYGPFPDLDSCLSNISRYEDRVRAREPTTIGMMSECRAIASEADQLEDKGMRPMPDAVS